MINKIVALLPFSNKWQGKSDVKKNDTPTQNQVMVDDYIYRYPPFPKGIPTVSIETIINSNQEMIQQIILARGLAGHHNAKNAEIKIGSPIRHLAEITHLLPASEKNHFRTPGGLFRFSLESALFGIRYAERRILTRVTPEIRRDNEALWTHAAFLTGLYSESILVISRLSVYSETGGIEWHPGMESIFQWLQRNMLSSYHIRWSAKEDRSMIYALAGKSIMPEQVEILAQGEKAIYKTLLSALHDQEDLNNPLVRINRSVKYKLIERDEASDPSRYGKPLAGMHLDPWLIDAMRHLVEKKRWGVNEDNGRCWHGKDGVYLVWPLAASDMQQELKASESPFVPNTKEILAELMQEAGIIERIGIDGGYLFDIAIPQTDCLERKQVTAIRLVRHEILFEKSVYEPLDQNLQIHFEKEEEEKSIPIQETHKVLVKNESEANSDKNKKYSENSDHGDDATSTEIEEVEMDILFGRQEKLLETNQQNKDHASDLQEENNSHAASDLLGVLIGCSKSKKIDSPVSTQKAADNANVSKPRDNQKGPVKQPSHAELVMRRSGVLSRLKKLPHECMESRPGGITKVFAKGLKKSNLSLKDCITVLKAADLLMLVEGLETGVDHSGSRQSHYFLVKADLLDGK